MKNTSVRVRALVVLCFGVLGFAGQLSAQAGWTSADVGGVGAAGSSESSGSGIVVRGSGADIWDSADEFRFVYRSLSGDGDFVARVASIQNTHGWAKAGIMFRDGLSPGAPNVFLCINPGGVAQFQQRSAAGAATTAVQGAWTFSTWLKVTRRGNVFAAFISQDGTNWSAFGSVTLGLSATLQVGLAVTSHNDGVLCTATFDPVTPPASGPPPTAPTIGWVGPVSSSSIEVNWQDNSNNEVEFQVARSTDNVAFTLVGRSAPNTFRFVDTGLMANTRYYYRVGAVANGQVANSGVGSATTFTTTPTLAAPTGARSRPLTSREIEIGWDPYPASDPSPVAIHVERSLNNVDFIAIRSAHPASNPITDIDLEAETTYYHRVRAVNLNTGEVSSYSNVTTARTLSVPTVSNLRMTVISSTELEVLWETPHAWSPDARQITTVHLERSGDGINFAEIVQLDVVNGTMTRRESNLTPATTYHYRARGSRVNGITGVRQFSVYSPIVTGTTQPTGSPAPGTWTSADVGAVGAAGSTSVNNGLYTLRGAGEDVWGPADEFHYHYRQWTGDGVFIVRVLSIENTFNWAKAGIMIRSELTTNAQHALAFVSPEMNTSLVYRTVAGGNTTSPVASDFMEKKMPMWLRLIREGDAIAMDYSHDSITWYRRGSTTIAFPATVYVGLAVNSHVDAQLCTATFDNFSLGIPRPAPLRGIARSPSSVYLRWLDNEIDESGFEVERSSDNVAFAVVGSVPAWTTPTWNRDAGLNGSKVPPPSFTDTGLAASSTYFYRVRSLSPRGNSPYSETVAVTTPAPAPAGWNYADIGDTSVMGGSTESGGVFRVNGAGLGVGGVNYRRESSGRGDLGENVTGYGDEFQFCFRPWSGDGEMVARLAGFAGAATGHAGIMVRVMNDAGYNVFCHLTQGGQLRVTARPGTGTGVPSSYLRETRSYSTTDGVNAPRWLKLVRADGGVMSYSSSDGVNWTEQAWVNIPLATEVNFGLAVSSQEDGTATSAGTLLTGTFDNVRVGAITTPLAPPAPPTNLRVANVSQTQVGLEWTPPTGVYDRIEVERSTDGVNFTLLPFSPSGPNGSYSDASVASDTTYHYRLRAVRGTMRSAYSNVVTTRTGAYPAPPSNLAATAVSSGDIDLTWRDNATNEDGFMITMSTNNSTFEWVQTVAANVSSTRLSRLNAGTTYYFRVHAYPTGGTPVYSNTASATTFAGDAVPAAPNDLVANAVAATRIELSWRDNANNETGFELQRSTDSVVFTTIDTFPPNTSQSANVYWDTAVSGGNTYYYRIRVIGTGGSAFSNTAQATTPGTSPIAPSTLTATAVTPTRIDLTWRDNSSDETQFELERSLDNASYTRLTLAPANSQAYSDTTVAGGTTYYYRIRALSGSAASVYATPAAATTPTAPSPGGWESRDIGAVAAAGSDSESGGTVTLIGSGDDIWNTADEFRYRYQSITGDGEIVARVSGLTNTHGWAKAGVMFRETLSGPSRHAWMCVSIAHGTAFQWRATTGGESDSSMPTETGGAPRWVRLVRAGSTFTGYESTDGSTWTQAGTVTLAMPPTIYVGLAVTSHNDGVLCSATFTNVSLNGGGTPQPTVPPAAPSGLNATAASSTEVNLAWTDASNNEVGFEIHFSTDNANFTPLTTTSANATSYAHGGRTPATTYYYRVRAVNGAGPSAFSNTASATTPGGSSPGTWLSQDVGAVAAAGSASETAGGVNLTGSGADIWNSADEFRYRYQSWTGDGTIVARVTSLTDTNGWAKAGVMFRETLEADSRHAMMIVSIAHGTALQYRTARGGESATTTPTDSGGVPRWLRLVRAGNTFTGAESVDGVNWTPAGSVTIDLPATIHVGLAVTSHNDGVLCTAAFESIAVTGGGTQPPPMTVAAPTNLTASAGSNGYARLTWTDNANNETDYRIERSSDGSSFVDYASIAANSSTYSDFQGQAGATYWYRVRAAAGSVVSGYSNTATFTVPNGPTPPPTWAFADVGAVSIAGSNSSEGNTITIRGSGDDIWGSADEFRFVYRSFTGDGVVEAQVTSQQFTHGWAKAGVMIRESLDANARNAFAFVTPVQHGVVAQSRTAPGSETNSVAGPARNAPYWVRLTRQGSTFTAASSPDGVVWSTYATFTMPMGATAYFGFAVTSHDDTQLSTAVFADPFVGAASP